MITHLHGTCPFCEIERLKAENTNLQTVMMAAAVEITEHWDAHCDAEGYGPCNLVRRLEKGYPAQYGYDAETLVRLEAAIERQSAALRVALECLGIQPQVKHIVDAMTAIKEAL